MRKLFLAPILAVGVLVAAVAPAGVWTSSTPPPTIAQIVAKSGGTFDSNHYDYDILFTAVKAAGLVDALNNPSSKLTVFAPNDMAFIRTARDFGYTGWDEAGAFNAIAGVLGTLDPNGKGRPDPRTHERPAVPRDERITGSDPGAAVRLDPDPAARRVVRRPVPALDRQRPQATGPLPQPVRAEHQGVQWSHPRHHPGAPAG